MAAIATHIGAHKGCHNSPYGHGFFSRPFYTLFGLPKQPFFFIQLGCHKNPYLHAHR